MHQHPTDIARRSPVSLGMRAALSGGLGAIIAAARDGDPVQAGHATPEPGLITAVISGLLDDFLPDTPLSSLRQELLAYAGATADMLEHARMKPLISEIIGGRTPIATEAAHALAEHLEARGTAIIERATLRGELGPSHASARAIDAMIAPIWLYGLFTGEHPPDRRLQDLAERAVRRSQVGTTAGG